jgi:hypothetical protein
VKGDSPRGRLGEKSGPFEGLTRSSPPALMRRSGAIGHESNPDFLTKPFDLTLPDGGFSPVRLNRAT